MASSSSRNGATKISQGEEGKPEWLESFLDQPFFTPCRNHSMSKEMLMKWFCIDCKSPNCSRCLQDLAHKNHSLIKIDSHFHQNVIHAATMRSYINIDHIRTYCSNKKPDLYLRLRPFKKKDDLSHNVSMSSTNKGNSRRGTVRCQVCSRVLAADASVLYCCIQCKLGANASKPDGSSPKTRTEQEPDVREDEGAEKDEQRENQPRHRRKGIPCRAISPYQLPDIF